jgi:hypothetical protein
MKIGISRTLICRGMTAMSGGYLNVRKDIPIMTDLTALISALERATGPDRELDLEIGLAFGGWSYVDMPPHGKMIFVPDEKSYYIDHPGSLYPSYTETVDAALAFMLAQLPGWDWSLYSAYVSNEGKDVWLRAVIISPDRKHHIGETAATIELAILLATLRAKQAEMNNDG